MSKIVEKDITQFKSVNEFEKAIEEGVEIQITNWLKVESRFKYLDYNPFINVMGCDDYVIYNLDRLNEILYAVERNLIENIINFNAQKELRLKKEAVILRIKDSDYDIIDKILKILMENE